MRTASMLLATFVVLAGQATLAADDTEWKPLFNGRDLTGWKAIDGPIASWKVDDGVLYCSGEGSGWLATEAEYGDFEVELEFRVPPGGNSGVFLRAPLKGNPAFAGMEVQILDDFAEQYANLKPEQYCGSLYSVAAAQPRVTKKPGEWQTMRIATRGTKIDVWLNGKQVVQADTSQHADKVAEHPGLKRTTGHVGLQNHGSRLDFRNVRIRELK